MSFFAGLTPEQQKQALEYRGPENHGENIMKQLFALRDNNRNLVSIYFSSKKEAKQVRKTLNEDGRDVYITKGPDHWLYREKPKPRQEKKRKNRNK